MMHDPHASSPMLPGSSVTTTKATSSATVAQHSNTDTFGNLQHSHSQSSAQKLNNATSLLDQYQDDDLTTNLLQAIRSWNKERPLPPSQFSSSSSSVSFSIEKSSPEPSSSSCCNSTIATTMSDTDTAGTATAGTVTSSGTSGTNKTPLSKASCASSGSIGKAMANTPCRGNYSVRASGLTARILLETHCDKEEGAWDHIGGIIHQGSHSHDDQPQSTCASFMSPMESSSSNNTSTILQKGQGHETGKLDQIMMMENSTDNTTMDKRHNSEPKTQVKLTANTSHNTILATESSNLEKKGVMAPVEPAHSINDIHALEILKETAQTLGLNSKDELHAVLPTVRKLVRVVMMHVPNLEKFVDDVCQIVIHEDDDGGDIDSIENSNSISSKGADTSVGGETMKRRRRKRPKKKNIQARKVKMDEVVHILRNGWNVKNSDSDETIISSSTSLTSTSTSTSASTKANESSKTKLKSPRPVLQKMNVNNFKSRDCISDQNDSEPVKTMNSINRDHLGRDDHDPLSLNESMKQHSEEILSFRNAIMEKLSMCQEYKMNEDDHEGHSSYARITSDLDDNTKALEIIENLINFEQKYIKSNGMTENSYSTTSSSSSGIESPTQTQSILKDLFDADTTTIRRFVLHFAYLFSVQEQSQIMPKMNDIYVFSNEASTLIEDIKKEMGLSPSCTAHYVARKVVNFVKQSQNQSKMEHRSRQRHENHVRFNVPVAVEEI